mmetsp:Transcript_9691/g.15865  ORF Transcript_9691/g.15865 Transcript_9691/m.15865 type:complete len:494 (-) Transcript_9691:386-1867(-)|eukprot:CAMPEP_0184648414 /NCGR_PEP_ID=MMETSP0308-20130426/5526_1 /TAXON_ID=38269 /ORGANISM="Gloeochaete witrockiana, Strain SAG 46.84" /LENGTH=493 /DNA_ID=CAMNT_0027080211 /DNA_START=54 /DNA_END=1535 /DNA_ORIENTATION=-
MPASKCDIGCLLGFTVNVLPQAEFASGRRSADSNRSWRAFSSSFRGVSVAQSSRRRSHPRSTLEFRSPSCSESFQSNAKIQLKTSRRNFFTSLAAVVGIAATSSFLSKSVSAAEPTANSSSSSSTPQKPSTGSHPFLEEIKTLPPEGALLSEEFQLPEDLRLAIIQGLVDEETMYRLENVLGEPILGQLVSESEGIMERFLADPNFLFKLFADEAVGIMAKLPAEYSKRGEKFWSEMDFVTTNVIMGIITEFLFTYTRAPTLSIRQFLPSRIRDKAPVLAAIDALPKNVFQHTRTGHDFTASQRTASFFYKSAQFFATGVVSGLIGTAISNTLIAYRESSRRQDEENSAVESAQMAAQLVAVGGGDGARPSTVMLVDASGEAALEMEKTKRDRAEHDGAVESGAPAVAAKKSDKGPRATPVVKNTLAYATFLATSSNTRYQALTGIDQLLSDSLGASQPVLSKGVMIAVRFLNSYWGSLQWISFSQALGINKK